MSERWEYTTHVTHLKDGDPWPICEGSALISGSWARNRKLVAIEPHAASYPGQYSTSAKSVGLAVWWIERVMVNDVPSQPQRTPEQSEYDQMREDLRV